MAKPMPLRKALHQFRFALARLLIGSKSSGIHFAFVGEGSSRQLCQRILDTGHQSVLVVTDGPLRELGIADQAVAGLTEAGIALHWYDGVRPDPSFDEVAAGSAILREAGCTAVLAIGGGSSMDAAKVIACTRYSNDDPRNWTGGIGKAPKDIAALYAIPTTAGTGSEATMGAVIKDAAAQQKHVISGEALLPKAVALDPALMTGLPPHVTAATGLDALTHGIEAFLATWERGSRREMAQLAIQGVFTWLPQAMATPGDIAVRQGLSVAAYHGGVAINQVNVGNIHAIAHQLGARYGISHGVANALVMPHVLECYGPLVVPQLAELAVVTDVSMVTSQDARATAMIEAIRKLRDDAGLPATDTRLVAADFDAIAEAAIAEGDGYFSPRLLTKKEVLGVLEAIKG